MFDNGDFFLGYMMGSSENGSSGGGSGSGMMLFFCAIGGFILECLFLIVFDIEVADMPAIFTVIGWIICSSIVAYLFNKLIN